MSAKGQTWKRPKLRIDNLDAPAFDTYEIHPARIIQLLETFHGDINKYVGYFFHIEAVEVLSRTMAVLNLKDNIGLRQRWDFLTRAFEEAKVLLAKREAMEVISKYKVDEEKLDLAKFVTYSRFWLAAHTTAETTRAKRNASMAPADGEAEELNDITSELHADDKETIII
jgi:hypothetical protein